MIIPSTAITAARDAGWKSNKDLSIALALAMAGSGLNENFTERKSNGSMLYGLWRIPSTEYAYAPNFVSGSWRDPKVNATMARGIFDRGGGWKAFPGYSGDDAWLHARYLLLYSTAATAVAVNAPTYEVNEAAEDAAEKVEEKVDSITGDARAAIGEGVAALRWLQQPETWNRIAKIALGGALVLGSILILVQSNAARVAAPVLGAVTGPVGKVAKTAAKGASS